VWYGLDLALIWPRLWLLLPDSTRAAIQAVNSRYMSATAVCAWGLLYLTLGVLWWPAVLAGAATFATGLRQARSAAIALVSLIEATIDIHQKLLTDALAIPLPHGHITPAEAARVNDRCAKNRSATRDGAVTRY
jgi:hypothetical protein